MNIHQLAEKCGWTLLCGEDGLDNTVDGCYIGDLLSWVMARAQSKNVWLTVMGNVNAIAVAVLTDVSAIVLCENAALDKEAKAKAEMQGVPVFSTAQNLYDTALRVYEALK